MSCHQAQGREDTPIVLMDRVYGETGAPINQASISSITYRVFEYDTQEAAEQASGGEEVGTQADLAPTSVIFDALQTAPPWRVSDDPAGYNFRFTLPGNRRPTGNRWHRVEIRLTPSTAGEEPYTLVWLIKTLPLASS